ncbi:MAG: hypothetical protein WCJ56_03640 [bacterium]
MLSKIQCSMLVGVLMLTIGSTAWASRFSDYTGRFKNNVDQAKALNATYLGGAGTEWLCGGGFQPDGTVVVIGSALGPTLSVAGTDATPLAADVEKLADFKPEPALDKQQNPKVFNGIPIYNKFGWNQENATAYLALLSADMKTVKSVVRFPWKSGSATSGIVDDKGGIYLAGKATDGLAKLCIDVQDLPVDVAAIGVDAAKFPLTRTYIAKFDNDGKKLLWLRTMTGPSNAPTLSLNKDGKITLRAADLRVYDKDGKLISATIVPGGLNGLNAVNPIDGTIAVGGEHNWPTGREPWRCPTLNIRNPNGSLKYKFYDWGGPFVGIGELRLVSDTAIRRVTYDDEGNLIFTAWSDGGNSPALRQPYDVYQGSSKANQLGMSGWGVSGALSFAYIVKLEKGSYSILAGTTWLAFRESVDASGNMRDKPNSISISSLGFGVDGSIVIGGDSAHKLIQTGNNFMPEKRSDGTNLTAAVGSYFTVLNKDLSSLRFSTAMLACGQVDINNGNDYIFASNTVNGKPMLLVLTGAGGIDGGYNSGSPAPSLNAVQPKYGGGASDGLAVVLDLTDNTPKPVTAVAPANK